MYKGRSVKPILKLSILIAFQALALLRTHLAAHILMYAPLRDRARIGVSLMEIYIISPYSHLAPKGEATSALFLNMTPMMSRAPCQLLEI